jgi:choline dehydrogenase
VTNGNIYAPVMMLAEKAADLVLDATPLEPERVEFYRHRPAAAGDEEVRQRR